MYNDTVCGLLCLAAFTWHHGFWIHLCCNIASELDSFVLLNNIPLYAQTMWIWVPTSPQVILKHAQIGEP